MINSKLKQLFADDPQMMQQIDQQETKNLLKKVIEEVSKKSAIEIKAEMIKGEKGDKGETGDIGPIGLQGEKGIKGETGEKGDKGEVGSIGLTGKRGLPGLDGKDGENGKDGKDAETIEVPTIKDIVKEIKKGKLLELKDIKGAKLDMNDQRWHGGGLTSVSHDSTLSGSGTSSSPLSVVASAPTWAKETPSGLINGINKTYIILHTPTTNSMNLIINGQVYTEGIDYSVSGTTITMVVALDSVFSTLPFVAMYTY